jgi:hypothetical protein
MHGTLMPTEPNTLSPRDARSSASLAALPEIRFACSRKSRPSSANRT